MVLEHRVADGHAHGTHDAADGGGDFVLHFHGFHDEQRLAAPDRGADLNFQRNDRALHRGKHRLGPVRAIDIRDRLLDGRFDLFAEGDNRQRIVGLQSNASGARCAGCGGGLEIQTLLRRPGGFQKRLDMLLHEARMRLTGQQNRVPQ